MFRTSHYSSSGGVLYKQLTVFHNAEIILKLHELSRCRLSSYSVTTNIKFLDRDVGVLKCYVKSIAENAITSCAVLKCCTYITRRYCIFCDTFNVISFKKNTVYEISTQNVAQTVRQKKHFTI